jgi:hypothetical protein
MINCPCTGCILILLCRYKRYSEIVRSCEPMRKYLYIDDVKNGGNKLVINNLFIFCEILNPFEWCIYKDEERKIYYLEYPHYKERYYLRSFTHCI